MDELTEDQAEQVDRLLLLHYARGIAVATKHVADTFETVGFTVEAAAQALSTLAAEVADINKKDKEAYGD